MNNFDHIPNRINTNSEKWDLRQSVFGKDVLPMWVADTDFMIPDFLIEDLSKRIHTSPLGYTFIPKDYFAPINIWHRKINNGDISNFPKEANATVMSSMNILIRVLTEPKDNILVFDPIYFPFFETIRKTDRSPIFFKLNYDFDKVFTINFSKLRKFIIDKNPKLILFCNPHNPGGKVWESSDISQLVKLSEGFNIPIVSDEIHSDIILHGKFTSLTDYFTDRTNFAVLDGPTKTFNIAGLKTSFVIFSNKELQEKFLKQRESFSYPKMNALAIESTLDVYKKGDKYLRELLKYLKGNFNYISKFLDKKYTILPTQATYLIFIKIPDGLTDDEFYNLAVENNIGIQLGKKFGENGKGFFRLNMGTQLKNIKFAVDQLNKIISD